MDLADSNVDVYFHTVLFPAMLLGDGRDWTMLHNISSTRKFLSVSGIRVLTTIRIFALRGY